MRFGPTIRSQRRAFTLLEVMIAVGIFFMATFAILGLISTSLANARRLQKPLVDASVLASQLSLTNKLVEGTITGNLADLLGKDYREYNYIEETTEVQTNHLYEVDFVIENAGNRQVLSQVNTFMYRPGSDPGSMDGGNFIKR
jgi:type II secretory pathway component PulJ